MNFNFWIKIILFFQKSKIIFYFSVLPMSGNNKIRIQLFLLLLPFCVLSQSPKEIDSLLDLSLQSYYGFENQKSIDLAKSALEKAEAINSESRVVEAYYRIARALCDMGKQQESFQWIGKAQDESFMKNNPLYRAKLTEVSALNYMTLGMYPQAIKAYRKTLSVTEGFPSDSLARIITGRSYGNLFVTYRDIGNDDSAYCYLDKEINILKTFNEKDVYSYLSLSYLDYGEKYLIDEIHLDSAECYFHQSLDLLNKYKDPFKHDVYRAFGDLNYLTKNYDKALDYYLRSQAIVEKLDYSDPSFNYILKRISDIYKIRNEEKLEKKYLKKFIALQDSISEAQVETVGRVTNSLIEKQEMELEETRKKIILYGAIILGLVLCTMVLVFYYFRRKQKKESVILLQNEKELARKENENQKLKSRINESFEEVVQLAKENDSSFLKRFTEIYPDFVKNIHHINPNIQSSEMGFCALLFLNFSTKDIAEYTFVTSKAVQNRKNRIRKKLNISSEEDIYVWMQKLMK